MLVSLLRRGLRSCVLTFNRVRSRSKRREFLVGVVTRGASLTPLRTGIAFVRAGYAENEYADRLSTARTGARAVWGLREYPRRGVAARIA
jgi:hypothetical protein